MEKYPPSLADDILTGASEIAAFLGWPERRVYHAASKGQLPVKRIGNKIISRRSALTRALSFEEMEADR